jgi:Uncharacterized conserved protein
MVKENEELSLFDEEEEECEHTQLKDVTFVHNDFNVSTIYSLIDSGQVKIPPFQRNFVWEIGTASRLIESIIYGLPIPQVFLYEEKKNEFQIIDGQQRLLSIFFFMKEKFPTKIGKQKLRSKLLGNSKINEEFFENEELFSKFNLKFVPAVSGQKNSLEGLTYSTLEDGIKWDFDYRPIRCVVIKQSSKDPVKEPIYEIFNRLNTGGQKLTPQEIRMSLFHSYFLEKIMDVNDDCRWRRLLNVDKPEIHFKDVESILRGLAMLVSHEEYKPPMYRFLNGFTFDYGDKIAEVDYLMKLFGAFLDCCSDLDQSDFASKSGKFNISLFESIFVATCEEEYLKKSFPNKTITKVSIKTLKENYAFQAASQDSVASKNSVRIRIDTAKKIMR